MLTFQLLANSLILGLHYCLIALAFYLVYSGTKIFHIGFGAIYSVTPYLFLAWAALLEGEEGSLSGPGKVFAVLLALGSAAGLHVLLELKVFGPLHQLKASPAIMLISSLGVYLAVIGTAAMIFGNDTKILNSAEPTVVDFAGARFTVMQIVQFAVSTLVTWAAIAFLYLSNLGTRIRALADNPELVGVFGINLRSIRVWIFALSAVLAGVASLLKGFDTGADLHSGLQLVLMAAVAGIVGGNGSVWGAVVGALTLGGVHNAVGWYFSAEWQGAATFAVFVMILLIRREGILSSGSRLEEV